MGRDIKIIELNIEAKSALEKGYKKGKRAYSRRCHIILLKNKGKKTEEIADIVGLSSSSVSKWTKRYEQEGIIGLSTRKGQGRKPIFQEEEDGEKIKALVKQERQRLKLAKKTIETELNKDFSLRTLKRFLKNLTENGNVFV